MNPSAPPTLHARSISWFTVVGATAAFVHYIVAVGLHAGMSVPPAWANMAGFALAFPVSYVGHQRLSFVGQESMHRQALPKFLGVAVLGFAANQLLLLSALKWLALPFWLVLGMVMGIIAVMTYLLSRYWAFRAK